MKFSTLICAGAFLLFAVYGDFEFPGLQQAREKSRALKARSAPERAIERQIEEVKGIMRRLEQSDNILTKRLEEIRRKKRSSRGRHAEAWNRADEIALLEQLKDVRAERVTAAESLEHLKTELIRVQVQQEMLKTAAERRTIENFLHGNSGPMEGIAEDLERNSSPVPPGAIVYESY